MAERHKVAVRADVLLKFIAGLEDSGELRELLGEHVSEALVVVAEDCDLRIENGGAVDLTDDERERFVSALGALAKVKDSVCSRGECSERLVPTERVRIRCDVLARVLRCLGNNPELRDVFGMPVLEALVVVAEGSDLRIENGGSVKLTEGQSSVFLGILNQIISGNME
ncbi:MAG: hypothetical protein JW724_00095 [Candidatus Altiarchaeota archaeon]|nr:hypothetical protein [Candidatus Altiarchaeota archaeon]